jgi:hypothetical protein
MTILLIAYSTIKTVHKFSMFSLPRKVVERLGLQIASPVEQVSELCSEGSVTVMSAGWFRTRYSKLKRYVRKCETTYQQKKQWLQNRNCIIDYSD